MITDLDASDLSKAIRARKTTCVEVMRAYLERIEALNPAVLALVSMADKKDLLKQAKKADAELAAGKSRGWLHGIPMAVKDIAPVAGFPCTMGSRLLAKSIPSEDGLLAQRMRAAGAIFIGRTNVPEFGLGSHSFNDLFGTTKNPWDNTKTAGGSSGGAAVALALRMLPLADGSDFMGSLRNPAGWNHVIGFRPSQGRVPSWPANDVWVSQLGTEGPMGRSVRDVARLLAVQSGPDARTPLARTDKFDVKAALKPRAANTIRVGWLGDLDGYLPMQEGVKATCEKALDAWRSSGVKVQAAKLGMDPAVLWQCWLVWRRALVGPRIAPMLAMGPDAKDFIKPEALWEHKQAAGTGVAEFTTASAQRSQFYQTTQKLFERFDVIALPSAQVWPFDASERWPKQIAGKKMDTYHRWMEATIYGTLLGAPTVCMPAGFGGPDKAKPLPMGIQFIGRPGADAEVLSIAANYEKHFSAKSAGWYRSRPA